MENDKSINYSYCWQELDKKIMNNRKEGRGRKGWKGKSGINLCQKNETTPNNSLYPKRVCQSDVRIWIHGDGYFKFMSGSFRESVSRVMLVPLALKEREERWGSFCAVIIMIIVIIMRIFPAAAAGVHPGLKVLLVLSSLFSNRIEFFEPHDIRSYSWKEQQEQFYRAFTSLSNCIILLWNPSSSSSSSSDAEDKHQYHQQEREQQHTHQTQNHLRSRHPLSRHFLSASRDPVIHLEQQHHVVTSLWLHNDYIEFFAILSPNDISTIWMYSSNSHITVTLGEYQLWSDVLHHKHEACLMLKTRVNPYKIFLSNLFDLRWSFHQKASESKQRRHVKV